MLLAVPPKCCQTDPCLRRDEGRGRPFGPAFTLGYNPLVPILGNAEKAELESLILEKLTQYHDQHGSSALLNAGVRVVVQVDGVRVDTGETADPLAAVEIRSLFTALCYVTGGTMALPRDALGSLATEATSAAAAQVNRIAKG